MTRLRRIVTVMRLETLHILRDRMTRSLLLVVPAIQLILFGYTVDLEPREVPVAVAGGTPEQSAMALRVIENAAHFVVVAYALESGGAERLVASGQALIGIELAALPDLAQPEVDPSPPRIIVDAADPAAVRPALAALEQALLQRIVAADHLGSVPSLDVEWRYNPERRTSWSIIPGLAGAVVMISMLMLGALTLVRERERGTWEGLLSTPVTTTDALIGKLLPYLPIGIMQTALVVLLANLLFDLPIHGDFAALLVAAALSATSYLAIGFAISARTRTQMQAIQLAVFLYLPSMLLSGFMFPFQGMPHWAQAAGTVLPLTHFVRISRDLLLRGATDARISDEIGWLAALSLICVAVAAAAYRRRLD